MVLDLKLAEDEAYVDINICLPDGRDVLLQYRKEMLGPELDVVFPGNVTLDVWDTAWDKPAKPSKKSPGEWVAGRVTARL
jgi:hypothetical protein